MEGLVPLDSPLSEEVFLSEVFESWFAVFLSAVDEPEPAGFTELPVLPSDADVMVLPDWSGFAAETELPDPEPADVSSVIVCCLSAEALPAP